MNNSAGWYVTGLIIGTAIGFTLYPSVSRFIRGIAADEAMRMPIWVAPPDVEEKEKKANG